MLNSELSNIGFSIPQPLKHIVELDSGWSFLWNQVLDSNLFGEIFKIALQVLVIWVDVLKGFFNQVSGFLYLLFVGNGNGFSVISLSELWILLDGFIAIFDSTLIISELQMAVGSV